MTKEKSTADIVNFTCGTMIFKKSHVEIVTIAANMAYDNAVRDVAEWYRKEMYCETTASQIEEKFGSDK